MTTEALAQKVRAGGRLSAGEALELYLGAPTHVLGRLADDVRRRRHPARTVTYIIDRNDNYTNVCVARCAFCAFYRPVGAGVEKYLRDRIRSANSSRVIPDPPNPSSFNSSASAG